MIQSNLVKQCIRPLISHNDFNTYNDDSHEATDKGQIADTKSTRTTNIVSMDATSYQIAYNIGGATVGLFHVDTDNSDFTAGKNETKTIASIAMEF